MGNNVIHMDSVSMDVFEKLKEIKEQKRISWKRWATDAGLSEVGVIKMFQNRSLSVENMLALCRVIDVNPGDLFEPQVKPHVVSEPQAAYGAPMQKVKELKKLLNSLERDLKKA